MKTLCLIDLSSIWHATWHATADQELGEAHRKTVERVLRIAAPHSHVAICLDVPPYDRKAISADYKAQRDKPSEAMIDQFSRTKATLTALGHLLWGCKGYEADDVIATATRMALADGFEHVEIHSGDKDLCQLVSKRVTFVSVQTGEKRTPADVERAFGVAPERMRDLLALAGDRSDNVPGVPGVANKTAAKLLAKFGDLDCLQSVISAGDPDFELGKEESALRAALLKSGALIDVSRKLVTLRDDAPISFGELSEEREVTALPGETPVDPESFDDDDDPLTPPKPREAEAPKAAPTAPATPSAALAKVEDAVFEDKPLEEQSTSIVRADWSLEPTSLKQAYAVAQSVNQARVFGLPNEHAAMAIILRGRTLGLDAVTSISSIQMIQGRPAMSAQLIVALVQRHPLCEYLEIIETTSARATWETKRKGARKSATITWTIEDAERAQLVKPDSNWTKYPQNMLRWRAAVDLCRLVYSDVILGIYSEEEMREESAS